MRKIQLEFNYISQKKDVGLARVRGEIDGSNINEFAAFLKKIGEVSCAKVLFDLKDLRYMNSTGFGNLAAFFLNEKDTGKREIYICNLHPNIQRTYRTFGMDQTWPTYPTIEEAIAALQKNRIIQKNTPEPKNVSEPILFPIIRSCTNCRKPSNFPKPGTYRCTYCSTIHQIDDQGNLKVVSTVSKKTVVQDKKIEKLEEEKVIEQQKKMEEKIVEQHEEKAEEKNSEKITSMFPEVPSDSVSSSELAPPLPSTPTPAPSITPTSTSDVETIDITISSNPNYLRRIRDFIFAFADEIFTEQERYNMSSAIDEALANAIEHAHQNDVSKKIFIKIEVNEKKFQVTIKDSGVNTFNNIIQRDNVSQEQLKKIGRGMGLLVIKQTMDEVSFNPTESWGTAITMIKYVKDKDKIE